MAEKTVQLRPSCLVVSDDEPPMDWGHVEALLEGLIIDQRPIYVSAIGRGIYRILNGRHRYVAALVRGDMTLTATLVESD